MTRKLFMRNDAAVVKAAQTLSLEDFKAQYKDATSEETLEKAYNDIRKKAGLNKTTTQRKVDVKNDEPITPPKEEVTGAEAQPDAEVKAEFEAEDGANVKVTKVGKSTVVEVEEPVSNGKETPGTEDNSDEVAAAKGKVKAKGEKKEKAPKKEKAEGSPARRTPEEMAAFREKVVAAINEGLSDTQVVKKLAEQDIKTYPPQVKGIRESLSKVK